MFYGGCWFDSNNVILSGNLQIIKWNITSNTLEVLQDKRKGKFVILIMMSLALHPLQPWLKKQIKLSDC